MRFAYFTHLPWPESKTHQEVLQETVEQFQCAEEVGFESGWLAEHHFSRYGVGSASLLVASNIAARTSKIGLGTAVLVPPLHNPIRLAEEIATLDVLSNGRVILGFGRGAANYEYDGYCVDREESQERFRETIGIIKGLWTTPGYTHKHGHYRVNQANLVPLPIQKPHPPIYIGATRTRATLEYVVSTGHSLIVGVVLDTTDALDLCRRFVQMSQEAGTNLPMSGIPFFRYFYVAETEEEARRDAEESLNWTVDMIQWRRAFQEGSEVYESLEQWRRMRAELPPSYDHLAQHRAIIGTPDQCVAKLKELRRQGIEYFGCNFDFGGMKHSKVLKSMQLFAREVMPHLQD